MSDWIGTEKCEICGKPAKNFLFASFLCECEECIQAARDRRGGPGGHQAKKWAEKKD
jgi:hypothetical protein